ncbi:CO/xanthine dehydrogenase Mo-binding subunit [Paraburkholderia sp. WC7.3g]|uniref:xanthine dehydrogenase family protein molybdopterin-binding subunit n=1 Tax=Paraburkholderia sp. WC7.3g TaxID=2991070 RepID=UPI003D23183D
MVCEVPVSRRTFLKVMGGSVVTITVSGIPALMSGCASAPSSNHEASGLSSEPTTAESPSSANNWATEPGTARWRIDGLSKVTGSRIFARDFKARDFSGWPKQENWLYALRCNCIDKIVEGYDLRVLPKRIQPVGVVDNDTLKANNISLHQEKDPQTYPDIFLFSQTGQAADCYGQPIALLIFRDFETYRQARKILDFNNEVIRYGVTVDRDKSNPTVYPTPKIYVRNDEKSFWNINMTTDKNSHFGPSDEFKQRCRDVRKDICALASRKVKQGDWYEFGTSSGAHFMTPAIDPVFMEPEAGLAWYDASTGFLQLVLGTQSPSDDGATAAGIFSGSNIGIRQVHVVGCYPGGSFGGRDKSWFPVYLALAAPFAEGALRWQQTRYEQFQVGLKRSETEFEESIWVDHAGKIQALDSQFILNAGGKRNLSASVADLAALSAMSCYEIPRAAARAQANYTPEVFGGSQRGFGGPQAYMAIETLLDEAAQALHKSPFDIRRANLLRKGHGKTITGAPILFDLQLDKLLTTLELDPLWVNKDRTRASSKLKYGVGLAMSNQAYGTGKDPIFAMVEIKQDGKLRVLTHYTDMGNGAATTLALAPADHLGQNAHQILMSEVDAFASIRDFDFKGLGKWDDSRSGAISFPFGSSSACLGAFHHFAAVDPASQALLLQSVLPAARKIWKAPGPDPRTIKWVNGTLTAPGYRPLTWSALFAKIKEEHFDMVAAAHITYAGDFWKGRYVFQSGDFDMDCDFIAVGHDILNLAALKCEKVTAPPGAVGYGRTDYAPSAALVAVSVNPGNGHVHVEQVVTALSAGRLICKQIVEGQSQGAVAMAIGNVLTEACPLGPEGPGNGKWNLDQYLITLMCDIPGRQRLIILDPPADKHHDCARGIGEAVICPIAPALLNALAMATGHRFRQTPVTPAIIMEALK